MSRYLSSNYHNCVFSNSFGTLHIPISFTLGSDSLVSIDDRPGYVRFLPGEGSAVSGTVFLIFDKKLPEISQIGVVGSDGLAPIPWTINDGQVIELTVDASVTSQINLIVSFTISDKDTSGGWTPKLHAGEMLATNVKSPKFNPSVTLAGVTLNGSAWEVTKFGKGVIASGSASELTLDIGMFKPGATVIVNQPEVGGYSLAVDSEAGTVVITPDSAWTNGDLVEVAIFAGY